MGETRYVGRVQFPGMGSLEIKKTHHERGSDTYVVTPLGPDWAYRETFPSRGSMMKAIRDYTVMSSRRFTQNDVLPTKPLVVVMKAVLVVMPGYVVDFKVVKKLGPGEVVLGYMGYDPELALSLGSDAGEGHVKVDSVYPNVCSMFKGVVGQWFYVAEGEPS
jgi:hypothetical protein